MTDTFHDLVKKLRLIESSMIEKAGGIPFVVEGNEIYVCLVTPTNAAYGGTSPQIGKGHIDSGENPLKAAQREVSEETGFNNFINKFEIGKEEIKGMDSSYDMYVYAFEMKERKKPTPDYEVTADWYSLDDAIKLIRSNQRGFINTFARKMTGRIKNDI
jgi:8-oxo-dGTP pyrophosphatase MutT (NUDIX family)